ncbi:MAG TPA: PAS domain-containing sensor histidine kinase, partial [Prolixibacteraceae bacterium]|nr:PAS domain-containing sensor histidine kinase [Prolixibacteraceae bacterium]
RRHFATIFTDITVQRKSELALRESERRFRDMMEHVNMVSAMLDVRGNITFANKYLLRLTGWKRKEIIGRNWFDVFISAEAPVRKDLFNGVDGGEVPLRYENEILTRAGEHRLIHWSNTILRDSKGKIEGIAGVGVDITDSKKAETALLESKASLVELNATKDKFFSIIAHDLKSPFNSILGLSSLLEDQVKEKNYEGLEEYASLIRTSSQLAYDLLKNLLEWSRSQTGKMEFSPEYIELVSIIGETIKLLGNNLSQKSIDIKTELPRNVVVFADKAMIGAVLRNLISNAIKFTRDYGQILISAVQNPEETMIVVTDNGVGINAREIDKLFRIDENHSTLGTHNEKGTGLGLVLCKEFIEKHGGKIWVESEFGLGSKFYFTIPRK